MFSLKVELDSEKLEWEKPDLRVDLVTRFGQTEEGLRLPQLIGATLPCASPVQPPTSCNV